HVNGPLPSARSEGRRTRTRLPAPAAAPGGGPHVKVYDAATGQLKFGFFAFDPNFTGGVRVAVGDVNGDGVDDIVCAAGPGGGPAVKVFDGATGALLQSFFAYDPGFTGGVFVAAGDVNGDGKADIIVGPGAGSGPNVRVFDGANVSNVLRDFMAYDLSFTGGVSVAVEDIDGDGHTDIVTGAGAGGGPHIRAFSGATAGLELRSFFAFDPGF